MTLNVPAECDFTIVIVEPLVVTIPFPIVPLFSVVLAPGQRLDRK